MAGGHKSPLQSGARLLSLADFLRAKLCDACDQLHGDGLRECKADSVFSNLVWREVVLERSQYASGRRIKRIVLLPPGKIEHWSNLQFVCGDLVGDHFLGLGKGS